MSFNRRSPVWAQRSSTSLSFPAIAKDTNIFHAEHLSTFISVPVIFFRPEELSRTEIVDWLCSFEGQLCTRRYRGLGGFAVDYGVGFGEMMRWCWALGWLWYVCSAGDQGNSFVDLGYDQ